MSKFITLVVSWLAVAVLLQHLLQNGTIYQSVGIAANSPNAIQLQAGIWDAFLLGFPALWFLSQFVKWFD